MFGAALVSVLALASTVWIAYFSHDPSFDVSKSLRTDAAIIIGALGASYLNYLWVPKS